MTAIIHKKCENNHAICKNNAEILLQIQPITKISIELFINTLLLNNTTQCIIRDKTGSNYGLIHKVLQTASLTVEINIQQLALIQHEIQDSILKIIYENQYNLNKQFINDALTTIIHQRHGIKSNNLITLLIESRKMSTIVYIQSTITTDNFPTFIKVTKQILNSTNITSNELETQIINYIKKNNTVSQKINIETLEAFTSKPKILKILFELPTPPPFITPIQKKEFFDKLIITHNARIDHSLVITILDSKDIIPDMKTVNNLISKVYISKGPCSENRNIASVLDIFILYGLQVTRQLITTLITKGCLLNNIEKYPIIINNEILEACATHSYYPYSFACKPPISVMYIECKKEDNLIIIKNLKEKGGPIDTACLRCACSIRRNEKVLKYIIDECNIKPDKLCLEEFSRTYSIDGLLTIMNNYTNIPTTSNNKIQNLIIDPDSTISIERHDIKTTKDKHYILKTKIKRLLNHKPKTIEYIKLYELMLKYLIDKKLVIGNYFIINAELSSILKINECSIMNVSELDNLISYFIDEV
ncbi:MAG: hypothetical protein Gaeavirus3_23 [Gaeavirus sp.]|uniref:Uncharacterized protein n=1 Tax=Gaeavirus sp. TaxID=2487767 RepID=A0A3G5A3C2_9VIRU|nr:MAG: hypothetical protein Gaeavirus3_23 [Gaeavirus sp.]